MKNQRICIIGDGLTGLTTTLALKNLNLSIDLFQGKNIKNFKNDTRTTAISESNYQYLIKLMGNKNNKYFWPSKKINLFYENQDKYLNFLNYENNDKNLMYIFENKKIIEYFLKKLKKSKNVNILNKTINKIDHNNSYIFFEKRKIYYDLIILCVGRINDFYKKINEGRSIIKDYKEFAITGTIKHNLKIDGSKQYFLEEGPFAILPFKRNMFSIVWSVSKEMLNQNFKNLIRKKLKYILGNNAKFKISKLQSFPIYLDLKNKYYKNNILILGQGIHSIHPIAGQGFNLILRDIKKFFSIVEKNLNLGIAIKNSYILKEFYHSRNPENTIIGLSNDLVHSFFKKNKFTEPAKEMFLKKIDKIESLKKVTKLVSDRGFFI